jgi:predicted NBD/HSP70 family sugar kinase
MYLLFDIGATKTRLAFSAEGKSIEDEVVFNTPKDYAESIKKTGEVGLEVVSGRKLASVAGGIAGSVSRAGVVSVAPHLHWQNVNLKEDLTTIFKAPVDLQNDTAVGGLGEAIHGAGRGYEIVAYITISTGVNGARIVNGMIDKSAHGFEIGPHIIDCGSDGKLTTFGQLVSGTAIEKKYDKMPSQIDDENIWKEIAKYIAIGVHNTNAFWSPDIIVLGGGVMQNKLLTIELIKEYLDKIPNLSVPLRIPHAPIVKAELRDISGLWGALECAKICGL